jgi:hypothetical protein
MMRRFAFAFVVAGSALAVAAPASAQYAPQPYGNGYGYNTNWGEVRSLQQRIDNVERQIRVLDRRNVVRDDRADRLRAEASDIERRLHRVTRNGLSPREANEISVRIARLEQRVQYAAANNYGGYRRY